MSTEVAVKILDVISMLLESEDLSEEERAELEDAEETLVD